MQKKTKNASLRLVYVQFNATDVDLVLIRSYILSTFNLNKVLSVFTAEDTIYNRYGGYRTLWTRSTAFFFLIYSQIYIMKISILTLKPLKSYFVHRHLFPRPVNHCCTRSRIPTQIQCHFQSTFTSGSLSNWTINTHISRAVHVRFQSFAEDNSSSHIFL